MSFGVLAAIVLAGLAGPLLSAARRPLVPVAVGELLVGVIIGRTGFRWLDGSDPTISFLADVGFAMLMLGAGMHVPLRQSGLRPVLRTGAGLAGLVAALAVGAGILAAQIEGRHAAVYAVLLASGSAAVVLPLLAEQGLLTRTDALTVAAQVAIADVAAIVAVPLVLEPSRAARAAGGTILIVLCAIGVFFATRQLREHDWVQRLRRMSKERGWALDLRLSLLLLFGLAWLAKRTGTSVLVAGFSVGLVVAAAGGPKRLSRQVAGVGQGFLVPLFFVVLGARLDLRVLGSQPRALALAAALFGLNVAIRLAAASLLRQPLAAGLLATAQLGVPIAFVNLGLASGKLSAGEAGALVAAALASLATTGLGGVLLGRRAASARAERAAPA
jgi:Kef-type K+ transport system membrane component KefB